MNRTILYLHKVCKIIGYKINIILSNLIKIIKSNMECIIWYFFTKYAFKVSIIIREMNKSEISNYISMIFNIQIML